MEKRKEEKKKGKRSHSVELVIHLSCVSRNPYVKFSRSVPSVNKRKANPIR